MDQSQASIPEVETVYSHIDQPLNTNSVDILSLLPIAVAPPPLTT